MPVFKDQTNREWVLRLDAPKIAAVRRDCGVDLAALDGTAIERLRDDPVLLVNSLWVLCRSQAGAGTSDQMFGESLVGDAIDRATDALIEAIADFFPTRRKEMLLKLAAQQKETREQALADAVERLTDPALQTRVKTAMKQAADAEIDSLLTRLSSATASPGSAVSAPKD